MILERTLSPKRRKSCKFHFREFVLLGGWDQEVPAPHPSMNSSFGFCADLPSSAIIKVAQSKPGAGQRRSRKVAPRLCKELPHRCAGAAVPNCQPGGIARAT